MNRCSLCPRFRSLVPSDGPTPCRVLIIGERPAREEDFQGRPFVGKTGQELEGLYLTVLNLPRSEVHITNSVMCSAKDYSNPTPEEAQSCSSLHLGPLLDCVRPQIVVPMGKIACSLFPVLGSSLERSHGMPTPGKWGAHEFILYSTYHPSSALYSPGMMIPILNDFDGLRKLLGELDAGTFTWPSDPYPEPDYRVCRNWDDAADYLSVGTGDLACDTESIPDKSAYCVTFSHTPGTGRLIYVKDQSTLTWFREWLREGGPESLIFHNYLHDVTVFEQLELPVHQFTDTMIRAYNLCLGGGGDDDEAGRGARGSLSLKMLAYRYLNMTMTSFRDTVYPHSIPLMLDWLKQVRSTFEPTDQVPTCICGCPTDLHQQRGKTLRHTGPCSNCNCPKHKQYKRPPLTEEEKRFNLLHRKTNTLITATENRQVAEELDMDDDDYPFVDPWKRVKAWHEWDHQYARDYVGPWPLASIEHVPEPELLKYACRDADATLRLHLFLQKHHPWLWW